LRNVMVLELKGDRGGGQYSRDRFLAAQNTYEVKVLVVRRSQTRKAFSDYTPLKGDAIDSALKADSLMTDQTLYETNPTA